MNKTAVQHGDWIKKALYICNVQYHFVIPRKILKGYVHKYHTESSNILQSMARDSIIQIMQKNIINGFHSYVL